MVENLHIVVLAAGEGTRMKSAAPKVLQTVGGRPMLAHVLDLAGALEPAAIHVVHGAGGGQVREVFGERALTWVHQAERRGTGHAVQQAMPGIPADARVLVLPGDHPLIPLELLQDLLAAPADALALLTMRLDEPAGYGRIRRADDGAVTGIVEQRDASDHELAITEVNSGILAAPAGRLAAWLQLLSDDNAQGEFYLTDIVGFAHADGVPIHGIRAESADDLHGANDRAQLAQLERRLQARRAAALMAAGAQLADPARCDIRGTVEVGRDVVIDANVVFEGRVRLGDGVSIGPNCVLADCELAAGTRVHPMSVLQGVTTTGACDIGPFARVRPGTTLAPGSRVGNFVEVKNTTLGSDSKASHLSYLGDSEIGDGVN
ncbi:MAG: bifunctional UDP-N-acetylglucosamine diphosphorylase/glucosamine-1-phosphate N-acetyltransferase GlmU, partial [Xanthomonadales bacterium]|nr:bifunctional UDP-N-acetylglucosamine diphosphorylase/glucosamine-1-phosphate N-acetyltransferase GlmU [Xanthomonadales bacterium]